MGGAEKEVVEQFQRRVITMGSPEGHSMGGSEAAKFRMFTMTRYPSALTRRAKEILRH